MPSQEPAILPSRIRQVSRGSGHHYDLVFESDGTPITLRRVRPSPPTIRTPAITQSARLIGERSALPHDWEASQVAAGTSAESLFSTVGHRATGSCAHNVFFRHATHAKRASWRPASFANRSPIAHYFRPHIGATMAAGRAIGYAAASAPPQLTWGYISGRRAGRQPR